MRKLTRYLLWAYVFTVPWDTVSLPVVGSASRLLGLAVVGVAVLTTAMEGRFRKPDAVLACAIAFAVWSALSLLWTMSYGDTVKSATTFAQLVASAWVIREFVRTWEDAETLVTPFCLGMFVPLADLLNNFRVGNHILDPTRFTGAGLNADAVGLWLALGLPMAWHLLMHRRGIVRVVALIYFVTAPVGLLLTGTRGAVVAGVAALTIVPLTLRPSLRYYTIAGVLIILGTVSMALVVPQASWKRILSTSTEIAEGGRMSGRREIWNAGLQAFPQRPLLGAGIGAYGAAVEPYLHNIPGSGSAHSLPIGLLVEGGIVGLGIFTAVLGACAWTILRSPPLHRALWGVLLLTWLVGGMSSSTEKVKLTWALFGLVAAQSGLRRTVSDVSRMEQASYTASESLSTVTT